MHDAASVTLGSLRTLAASRTKLPLNAILARPAFGPNWTVAAATYAVRSFPRLADVDVSSILELMCHDADETDLTLNNTNGC